MQFDWFTFVIQIINFLILLLLLRRFLYQPILQVMEARGVKLVAQFQEAADQMENARREAELFSEKRLDLEATRTELLAEAEADALAQRKRMVEDARQSIEELERGWYAAFAHEKRTFLYDLRQRVSDQVFEIAQRALRDLADAELERQVLEVFLLQLQHLDRSTISGLAGALQSTTQPIVIYSTFTLSDSERSRIRQTLRTLLSSKAEIEDKVEVQVEAKAQVEVEDKVEAQVETKIGAEIESEIEFAAKPELLCGIELQAYGRRFGWNVRDYLATLEATLHERFPESL